MEVLPLIGLGVTFGYVSLYAPKREERAYAAG